MALNSFVSILNEGDGNYSKDLKLDQNETVGNMNNCLDATY